MMCYCINLENAVTGLQDIGLHTFILYLLLYSIAMATDSISRDN